MGCQTAKEAIRLLTSVSLKFSLMIFLAISYLEHYLNTHLYARFSSHFEKLNWHFLLFKVDVVKQLLSNIQNGIDVVHPVRVNLVGHVDQRHLKTGKIEVLHPHRNSFNRS